MMSPFGGSVDRQWTGALGRNVYLRPDTSDRQVWGDTFTGLYHLPPVDLHPSSILDLGANIGLVSAHYKALWPEAVIVAIEMDEANAALAVANAPGVRVAQVAVSAFSGIGSYDPNRLAEAYNLDPVKREGFVRVGKFTITEIIDAHFDSKPVDLVKMDVEGAEWEILANASEWRPLVRNLLVELHAEPFNAPSGVLVERAVSRLEASGYQARRAGHHPRAIFATCA